jgi:hypothetical protein
MAQTTRLASFGPILVVAALVKLLVTAAHPNPPGPRARVVVVVGGIHLSSTALEK